MLDLKSVLNSDKVILIDTGDIHGESSKMFTVLFLSHLWTSVRSIWTPTTTTTSRTSSSRRVRTSLAPKSSTKTSCRKAASSTSHLTDYAVSRAGTGDDPRANRRSYKEILNNINTKIIGNIATDDMLAESLFHEDLDSDEIKDRIAGLRRGEWVVQLPSTGFHEQKPEILTLKPLPSHRDTKKVPSRFAPNPRWCAVGAAPVTASVATTTRSTSTAPPRRAAPQTNANKKSKTRTKTTWRTTPSPTSIARTSKLVFDALTDGVSGYTLGKSMKELPSVKLLTT